MCLVLIRSSSFMFWWHTAIYRKRKAFVIPRVSDQSRCWKRSLDRKETDAGAPWALDNISFLIEVWNLETTLWVQLLLLDMLVIFLLLLNRIFLNKKKFTWNWCWFNFFFIPNDSNEISSSRIATEKKIQFHSNWLSLHRMVHRAARKIYDFWSKIAGTDRIVILLTFSFFRSW